jgi:translation initiation factor IF-2
MSEPSAVKRLSKVATELNVGVQTVIDFLVSKGFDDINRNSKITDEMYAQLLKAYGTEKDAKEESKKIIQNRMKRETVELDESQPITPRKDDVENEPEEVLIKNLAPVVEWKKPEPEPVKEAPAPAPKEEPEETFRAETPETPGVKVLGTIDLSSLKGKGKKKDEKEEVIAEKPVEITPEPPIVPEIIPTVETLPVEQAPPETATPTQPEEPFRIERKKLEGPTILGRIELQPTPVKKPVASSSNVGSDSKKKRKRIDSGPAGGSSTPGQSQQQQRPGQQHGNRPPRPGQQRPAAPAKAQLTEEEVQKQIKETLARLSQGKQKSKSAKYRKQKREDFRAAQEEAELEKTDNKTSGPRSPRQRRRASFRASPRRGGRGAHRRRP